MTPSSMSTSWRNTLIQVLLAMGISLALVLASSITFKLQEAERKVQAGANREPQLADPTSTFVEIVLDSSPLAQLSAGFVGIAPSMHLIRSAATRPLSNIDPIEHPARRRFGRLDFSFAFLVFLPIALLPICFMIHSKCMSTGDAEKLLSGQTKLFDFTVERILLPLFAFAALVFLVTIACLYSSGLRLSSNELLARLSVWALLVSIYLTSWVLLFAFLILRSGSFPLAAIQYSAVFLILVIVLPQFLQSVELAMERPKGRLPLVAERRKLAGETLAGNPVEIERYFKRQGLNPPSLDPPLPRNQLIAITNLRIEEKIAPMLLEFEDNVRKLDEMAIAASWLSPFLVTQFGIDDLAGTGLARYSRFRIDSIQFHEEWRKYTLGFLAQRKFLDFDDLRAAPKFKATKEDSSQLIMMGLLRCLYLTVFALGLIFGINRSLAKILPARKRAAL